ncbi:MAG TPA: hypothetical protein DCM62_05625 [Bacteroidales bacterium]|nr:hypothetical protein [Bacteroidales bacterium]
MAENARNLSEEPAFRSKSIKYWALDDRPREKMLLKGSEALSDAELLAIILGSGSQSESAVELSKRILGSVGYDVAELSRLYPADLMKFKGVGEAKAINIVAALELGKRRQKNDGLKRKVISQSSHAFEILQPMLADRPYEEFWIITLSRANKVKRLHCVGEGGVEGTVADPKKIFRMALDDYASNIILCHNHPSGNLKPSDSDIKLTQKCVEAGKVLDLRVMDHIIVGQTGYYSFADNGMI